MLIELMTASLLLASNDPEGVVSTAPRAGSGAVLMETVGNYNGFWPVMVVVGLLASALNWMTRAPGQGPRTAAA